MLSMFMEHEASSVNSTHHCLQRAIESTNAYSSCVANSLWDCVLPAPHLTTQAVSLSAIQGLPKADPGGH